MIEQLFHNMIGVSITIGALVLLVLLVSPLLDKMYRAKCHYFIWFILAVRLVLPFNFTIPQAPIQISLPTPTLNQSQPIEPDTTASPIVQDQTILPITPTDHPQVVPTFTTTQNAINHVSLIQTIMVVWFMGAMILVGYQIIGYSNLHKYLLRWSKPMIQGNIYDSVTTMCIHMDIKKPPQIRVSTIATSPLMIGFFHPTLVLSDENYNSNDLYFILKHELTHYKRYDVWYKLLLFTANVIHWFNPIVWIMCNKATVALELSCDDEVTCGIDKAQRKAYCEIIMASIHHQQVKNNLLTTYFNGGTKTMKDRFKNVFDTKKKHNTFIAVAMVCALVVGSSTMVGLSPEVYASESLTSHNPKIPTHYQSDPLGATNNFSLFIEYNQYPHMGIDARSQDISTMIITEEEYHQLTFDSKTHFKKELPKSFDPVKIMEEGKRRAAGVDILHNQKITGKGVNVGIVSSPLASHIEYNQQIKYYKDFNSEDEFKGSTKGCMLSSALASGLVGSTTGIAPDTNVYYATIKWTRDESLSPNETNELTRKNIIMGINHLLILNEELEEKDKLSVVFTSIFDLASGGLEEYQAMLHNAQEQGIWIVTMGESPTTPSLNGVTLDLSDFKQYLGEVVESQTYASPIGEDDYVYYNKDNSQLTYLVGVYTLAKQVAPNITPHQFKEMVEKTALLADHVDSNGTAVKNINPDGIIEECEKI